MSIALRPRSMGEVLDGAFRLMREDFGLYSLTAIICLAPVTVLNGLLFTESMVLLVAAVLMLPLAILGTLACWPALTHQIETRLQGDTDDLSSGLKRGIRLSMRMLGIWLLGYFAFGGLVLVLVVALAVVIGGLSFVSPVLGAIVGVVLGVAGGAAAFALLVPPIFIAVPVSVIENASVLGSFSRGLDLTRGARLTLAALFFVTLILFTLPTIAVLAVTGTMGSGFSPESATLTLPLGVVILQQGLSLLVAAVTGPFMAAVMVLAYYDRRIRSEGYDLESAADDLLV